MAPKAKPKAKARRSSSNSSSGPAGSRRSSGAAGAPSPSRARAKLRASAPAQLLQEAISPEVAAALRLQAAARGLIARRHVAQRLQAKRQADRDLQEAARRAELEALRLEREREEAVRELELEKERKRRELEQNVAKLGEYAFDDDLGKVEALLATGLPVDAKNRRGVTALSEAACGGAETVVRLLLQQRWNPNCAGEFGRTPLWRASYHGHTEVLNILLSHGGDPRVANDEGEFPVDVAPSEAVSGLLRSWDVTRTDALIEQYEAWIRAETLAAERFQAEALKSVEAELEAAKAHFYAEQRELAHLKAELRRRITEHDLALSEGSPAQMMQGLRRACETTETRLDAASGRAAAAQRRLDAANVRRLVAAEAYGAEEERGEEAAGRAVQVRDLHDVLLRDVGDRIARGEKWPLVIDASDCAAKFLQYSGNAVLNCWDADEMSPEHVRRALLSMIRAGGVLAVNLLIFGAGAGIEELAEPFEDVQPGLFDALLSRDLLRPHPEDLAGLPRFHGLLDKEKDAETFESFGFGDEEAAKFKFVVLTSATMPNEELLGRFEVLRVIPGPFAGAAGAPAVAAGRCG
eukprot:TRINITY_DN19270_c0_g1_i1.p1 TRINITY_DN19270_c0_g1~~TRINITY_DN19270_c0_g1_i1.p1  ORF type:complete len:580 (-),score=184.07 TRINITY_DN19270_c0_g1_i1:255-1994(-)